MLPKTPAGAAKARTIEEVMDTALRADQLGHGRNQMVQTRSGRAGARHRSTRIMRRRAGIYEWLARQLGEREWFNGESFGWADLSVVPYLNGARGNGIGPDTELAARQMDRARKRASLRRESRESRRRCHRQHGQCG